MAEIFQPNDTRPTCSETLGSFAANPRYEALPAAAIRRLQDHVGHAQPHIEVVEHRLTGIGCVTIGHYCYLFKSSLRAHPSFT